MPSGMGPDDFHRKRALTIWENHGSPGSWRGFHSMKPRSSSRPDQLQRRTRTHHSQMRNAVMKIRVNLISALCLAAGFASSVAVAKPDAAPPAREAIEWCDIWISHANETNLPRVLLLADSIARDYYPGAETRLAGKAFGARLATSRFVADPVLLKEIELVLTGAKFDVIQFNNGMHGWQHSEEAYRKAFPKLIRTIRTHAPKARL